MCQCLLCSVKAIHIKGRAKEADWLVRSQGPPYPLLFSKKRSSSLPQALPLRLAHTHWHCQVQVLCTQFYIHTGTHTQETTEPHSTAHNTTEHTTTQREHHQHSRVPCQQSRTSYSTADIPQTPPPNTTNSKQAATRTKPELTSKT